MPGRRLILQGHGKISDIEIESPIIRYGYFTKDEFFIPYSAASSGLKWRIQDMNHLLY